MTHEIVIPLSDADIEKLRRVPFITFSFNPEVWAVGLIVVVGKGPVGPDHPEIKKMMAEGNDDFVDFTLDDDNLDFLKCDSGNPLMAPVLTSVYRSASFVVDLVYEPLLTSAAQVGGP